MVYVQNRFGKPLMPTKDHRMVRLLLNEGKATVVRKNPFTIRLKIQTKEYVQPITLGVDAGSRHIGLSACTEEEELFCAELQPRNDVVNLLSTRRECRRARRNRTKRYRAPRFENRVASKKAGWVAPSVQVKIHNHIQGIRFATKILPISKIIVETAEFDTQRLKALEEGKPLPVGEDYQHGEMYDQYNVRQYVLWRDDYTCQCCGVKPTDKKPVKLHVHHLESRKTGGEAPGNKITLCEACHDAYHKGLIQLPEKRRKRSKSYRDAAFMGVMRKALLAQLRELFAIPTEESYGYITKYTREKYGIKKTHTSDAQCIANTPLAKPAEEKHLVIPVRRHNRQIRKASILKGGIRKKNQAPKQVFGFKLFDLVRLPSGEYGFIFGRRSSGFFDVRHLGGKKISASISYKKLKRIEQPRNLLMEKIS